jgi:hypothetical protein
MTARLGAGTAPRNMTFYLDASIPLPVATAIAALRGDVLYAGGPGAPSHATPDTAWLRHAGERGWLVITRDKRIRRRPGEREAYTRHGVGVFCLTAAGNATKWDTLVVIASRWERMEEVAAKTSRPFMYAVTREGLRTIGDEKQQRPHVVRRPRQGLQ